MPAEPAPRRRAGGSAPSAPTAPPRQVTARPITLAVAAATWCAGWLAGNVAGAVVLNASGHADTAAAERPVWVTAATAAALWVPQIVAIAIAAHRVASGNLRADLSLRFRPVDLLGVPIGIISQLVLLRLVYAPLRDIWPMTFSDDALERNARELYDRATGGSVIVLLAVVVIGAPLVEELVYRGLLQRSARRRLGELAGLVAVAAFFALVHFRPIEYPGLFVFGLVLGGCLIATDRIGMGILAHMAFNATALALIA